MIHIFKHTGEQCKMRNAVVVMARDEVQAAELVRKELDSMGLQRTAVNIVKINQLFQAPSVIHSCREDF